MSEIEVWQADAQGHTDSALQEATYDTIGELSYAPTVQTTTVTTTTTTTVTQPPLLIRAPIPLCARDPDSYPLAAKETPSSLKRIRFLVEGKAAYFEEADNPAEAALRVRAGS